MAAVWTPDSWRQKPIVQVPEYPDAAALAEVERNLQNFPPLVFIREVQELKKSLAGVARGESFLLQGGDCAESFREHKTDYIRDYFQLFLQMALILTFRGNTQVVKVGRVAGQFAKPRSSPTEKQDGRELPSYRGDIINGPDFTPDSRIPDPQRQIEPLMHKSDMAPYVNLKDVGSVSIPVPDIATQQEIGAVQRQLLGQAHALVNENAALAYTRDQLLPLLMSGRISVNSINGGSPE